MALVRRCAFHLRAATCMLAGFATILRMTTSRAGLAGCLGILLTLGCTDTPTAPSVLAAADIGTLLVSNNLNHPSAGARGRLTRWRVPIEVNTGAVPRAEEAVAHYEQWSGGVIRFTRVSATPANGIVFVDGGAVAVESGCADVTSAPDSFVPRWDSAGALVGTYTIHLGSDTCNDATKGRYRSAYAEHVLGHALGLFDHFAGFTGQEGLVDAHAFSVIYNLYANPIGATAQQIVIWPANPR